MTTRRLANRLEFLGGTRYALTCAIAEDERRALTERADYLADMLAPAPRDAILRSVGALRVMKGEAAVDRETREALMNAHTMLLGHFPAWAIEDACAKFMRGRDRFAPDAGEIAAACEALLIPHRAELRKIEHVLDAEVQPQQTDEDRAKVLAELERLKADLIRNADPRKHGAVEGSQEEFERVQAAAACADRHRNVEAFHRALGDVEDIEPVNEKRAPEAPADPET